MCCEACFFFCLFPSLILKWHNHFWNIWTLVSQGFCCNICSTWKLFIPWKISVIYGRFTCMQLLVMSSWHFPSFLSYHFIDRFIHFQGFQLHEYSGSLLLPTWKSQWTIWFLSDSLDHCFMAWTSSAAPSCYKFVKFFSSLSRAFVGGELRLIF